MSQNQQSQKNIRIQVGKNALPGFYANHMQIGHTREEFILDFFKIFPPQGEMCGRIIVSPGHLKRMVSAMKESIEKYEKNFGNIEAAEGIKSEIGFQAENNNSKNND